jgi:hypothetical protein
VLAHLVASAVMAAAAQAPAQPKADPSKSERAQALFDSALKLMDARDFAHACPLLEQSEQLDPGMGTRFRLAECYEGVGRLASAWTLFNDVADAAKWAQSPERERVARQRAVALEPRLSKATVEVPAGLGVLIGLEIRWDNKVLSRDRWGVPRPVDPGEHKVEAVAKGKKPWEQAVKIDRPGATAEVKLPEDLEDAPSEAEPPPVAKPKEPLPEPEPEPSGPTFWSTQRIAAVAAAGAGGIGLLVGIGFGASAASDWDEAQKRCTGGEHDRCTPAGVALAEDASSSAAISTVGFLIGVAGLGAGAYLWFTAPPPEAGAPAQAPKAGWQLAPALAPGVAGGVLRARF